MITPDDGFVTEVNDRGEHRWVYTSPHGVRFLGPNFYPTAAAAIRAGREWLKKQRSS
jgi:hypothetical protein